MGWASEDEKKLPSLKTKVSRAREAFYALKSSIREVRHDEKREPMMKTLEEAESLLDQAYDKLYDVDRTLVR